MAGPYAGKNLKLKDNAGVVIAGIRSKSFSIANEPIDVTTDDDGGIRTLLETAAGELDPASKAIDLAFDGLTKDAALIAAATTGAGLLDTYTIELPDGGTIAGKFALVSLELTGEYQDAMAFSGSLQSSGAWTYTP